MGKEEKIAFENIKNELFDKPLVQRYSYTKEATVTTDASEKAIGGVLSQEGHPVIYVSMKLAQAEQTYSNIEREALAIVFVVTRLKQLLLGRKFLYKLTTNLSNITSPQTKKIRKHHQQELRDGR